MPRAHASRRPAGAPRRHPEPGTPSRELDPRALARAAAYPHPVTRVRLVETHISWVLLTGDWAYKVKKPVSLGFLDYSTLERRRRACLEELRLNRRLAPELYFDVVPITGTPAHPCVDGRGKAFEYAVKMREFPQAAQLDRQLAAGRLRPEDMDALAEVIAAFHEAAPRAPDDAPHGTPENVHRPVRDTLALLDGATDGKAHEKVAALATWITAREETLRPLMARRRHDGRVREVHGDLHLANLVRLRSGIAAFDCIEFNAALRWIDVINDLAFATMDLAFRGRPDLGYRLLNRYLEITGDYEAVPLLRYYEVYRALVRAKVAEVRATELPEAARAAPRALRDAYLDLALARSRANPPLLILMHGVTGSGKTWLSTRLAPRLPAVRVRSDVERRRLHGLGPAQPSGSALDAGIYGAQGSARTYALLAELAAAILRGGETALVDAAFLRREDRDAFRQLAREFGARFAIVSCSAPVSELERRIAARGRHDASEGTAAVLARQLATRADLGADERADALTAGDADTLAAQLRVRPEA